MTSVNRNDAFPTRKRAPTGMADRRHVGQEMVRRVPKGDAPKRRPSMNTIVVLATIVLVIVAPASALRSFAIKMTTAAGHTWATAAQGIIRRRWAIIVVGTDLRTWAIIAVPLVLRTLPITRPAANEVRCLRIIPACEMAEAPITASRIIRRAISPRIVADHTTRGCTLARLRLIRTDITRTGMTSIMVTMHRGAPTGIAGRISATIADMTGTMLTTGLKDATTRTVAITIARIMRRTLRTDAAMTDTARRIATAASADVRAIEMTTGSRIAGRRTATTAIVGRRANAIEIRMR